MKKLRVNAILYVLIYQLGVQRASHEERERDEVKRVKYGEMNYGYFTRKSPAYEVVFTCILQLTSRPASNNFVKKINSCDLLNTNT